MWILFVERCECEGGRKLNDVSLIHVNYFNLLYLVIICLIQIHQSYRQLLTRI